MNCAWGISYEIALRWMPLDLTDDKSTLVQVMAWCRQATSHYLNQCWPRSMSPNGVTRPQWIKLCWVGGILITPFCVTAHSVTSTPLIQSISIHHQTHGSSNELWSNSNPVSWGNYMSITTIHGWLKLTHYGLMRTITSNSIKMESKLK